MLSHRFVPRAARARPLTDRDVDYIMCLTIREFLRVAVECA